MWYFTARISGDLFCKHISSLWEKWFCTYGGFWWLMAVHNVNLIPISSTSSWPCLYARDFYGLFCILTSPWWAYVYIIYVYLCISWWYIPYICPLSVTCSVRKKRSDCLKWTSSPTLDTSVFYDLFRSFTYPLWDYFIEWYILWLHVHVPLVTYSVHTRPICDLFCI